MKNSDSEPTYQDWDTRSVSELVGGFVHEVKNPLTSIRLSLGEIERGMTLDESERAILGLVRQELVSINKTITELREFTRIGPPQPTISDLNLIASKVLDRIRPDCDRNSIRLEVRLSSQPLRKYVDVRQIQLGFLQLLTDMIGVMSEGGRLAIHSSLEPGGAISVVLEDSGGILPEEHLERLFKPFLSTRGRGGGIGLAMARKLIAQNGGVITVVNSRTEGLRFEVVF